MPNIITTTKLQQHIGALTHTIEQQTYIVTNRGQGRIVMLPYFSGCDEAISDYMEDYEMANNADNLRKRYQQSVKSGRSRLVI